MPTPKPRQGKDKVYLTTNQLRARYGGRSTMFIERKLKNDPRFPRPVKIGGRWNLYDLDAIEAYERACTSDEGRAA